MPGFCPRGVGDVLPGAAGEVATAPAPVVGEGEGSELVAIGGAIEPAAGGVDGNAEGAPGAPVGEDDVAGERPGREAIRSGEGEEEKEGEE